MRRRFLRAEHKRGLSRVYLWHSIGAQSLLSVNSGVTSDCEYVRYRLDERALCDLAASMKAPLARAKAGMEMERSTRSAMA